MLSYFLLFTNYNLLVPFGNGFKYSFLTIYIIEILIAFIALPFMLRLTGQLLVHALKYRQTIKDASFPEEFTPYYEHYRIMFCLLFVIMLFTVFNLIKAFYIIKPLFVFLIEPISLNFVLNFWFSLEDAIISFGLISMVQIMYFFQEKKFNFWPHFLLVIMRFFWVFLAESGLIVFLILTKMYDDIYVEIRSGYSLFIIEIFYFLRMVLIFRFAKEGNDIVKKLIDGILGNPDLMNALGHERVENVYRATVLFRALSWGNFILALLNTISSSTECTYFISRMFDGGNIFSQIFYSAVLINELVYLLSSVLYSVFFLILWKFLFNKSKKVKISGYSHFNESDTQMRNVIEVGETVPLLPPLTFSTAKTQKILFRYYSIITSFITILIVAFITPLSIYVWNSVLFVHKGDYYMLKQTGLYKAMESCTVITAEVVESNWACNNVYFGSFEDPTTPSYQNSSLQIALPISFWGDNILWVPANTTISSLENFSSLNIFLIMQSDMRCLQPYETEFSIKKQAVNFDCVIPENNYGELIANCSNTSCHSFQTVIPSASMLYINGTFSSNSPEAVFLKQTYNLSTMPNVRSALDIMKSEQIFDWKIYDFVENNETRLTQVQLDDCKIWFKCTFPAYIAAIIAILTLLFIPIYLMISVLLIHRY